VIDKIKSLYTLVAEEINSKKLGLDQLLSGKLSPTLVNSTVLGSALQNLKERAMATSHVLPVDTVGFVYQLPVSFITNSLGELTIFAHIPVLVPNNVLTLYVLFVMPVALEDSIHSVKLLPESEFLAINSDRDGFIPINADDLTTCHKLGQLYLCDKTNYLLKDFDSYCITGLFLNREGVTTRVCPTAVVPNKVVITQVG
jgi:hypothetical protein